MRCFRLTFLFLLLALPSTCFSWPAKVVAVTDGDTIIVLHNGQHKEIRLYGIDCPEKEQRYGEQARALTAALVAGRNVDIKQKDTDQYKRIVGLVKVDGQNLSELIVQNGYAWVYTKHCKEKFCSDWKKSERVARRQKKGMWSDSVVVPPWEWRAAQREGRQEQEAAPVIIIGGNKSVSAGSLGKPTLIDAVISFCQGNKSVSAGSSGKQYRCDGRTYCSQMTSCDEAKFFLRNCPGTKMDGDNDGVPCERQWCR